jgi:glycolate oxidase iron-sulfur subunit
MRTVELEGTAPGDAFRESMETCVQCRGCEAACPSSVPFGHLMEGTRAALASGAVGVAGTSKGIVRRAIEWSGYALVLPRHSLLLGLSWVLSVGQRLHLVPHRLGIPRLSARSLRTPLVADERGRTDGSEGPAAYLFPGCVMDAWQRDVHRDALTVMRATGTRALLPGRGADCCGALHAHAGRVGEARRLARRVVASMPGDAAIVVDSAGCGAAMKEYGRLLGTADAEMFSSRVRDFSEWVAAQTPLPLRDTGTELVVQDPCHLRHVQRVHGAVRTVLLPAYRLRETDDDGLCCGAGGAYAVLEPELAGSIRERKVAALRAAAGDDAEDLVVVSANPGCAMHLAAAGLEVRHPAELLARALRPHPAAAHHGEEQPHA